MEAICGGAKDPPAASAAVALRKSLLLISVNPHLEHDLVFQPYHTKVTKVTKGSVRKYESCPGPTNFQFHPYPVKVLESLRDLRDLSVSLQDLSPGANRVFRRERLLHLVCATQHR